MAQGCAFRKEGYAPATDWDMSHAGAAGALYSTVRDLHVWNEAFHGGKVLQAESYAASITPVELPEGVKGMSYGYGLVIAETEELGSIRHGGGLHGWRSALTRFPKERANVIVLANASPAEEGKDPVEVTQRVTRLFLVEARPQAPKKPVQASEGGD